MKAGRRKAMRKRIHRTAPAFQKTWTDLDVKRLVQAVLVVRDAGLANRFLTVMSHGDGAGLGPLRTFYDRMQEACNPRHLSTLDQPFQPDAFWRLVSTFPDSQPAREGLKEAVVDILFAAEAIARDTILRERRSLGIVVAPMKGAA